MSQGTAAREAAFRILQGVRSGQRFEEAQLAAVVGLSDSDRRLAHEIAAGVLRGRTELDRRLRLLVSRDWDSTESDLRDLLRIGMYQLTRLNRVPAYAAVHATVEVAKEVKGSRGAGLINAVLRRVSQEGEESLQHREALNAKELAAKYSHPSWLVERWTRQFGLERTRALLVHNNRRPPLVIQPARWSLDRLRDQLLAEGVSFSIATGGAGLTVERGRVEKLPGYGAGGFVVQDSAQALLLEYAQIPENAIVWDACAAPGGKTAVMSRRGRVIASDLKRDRIPRLRGNLARTAPSVPVFVADACSPPLAPMTVDVAVVDAPCSATGTMGRHPDSRWRITERSIGSMAARQARMLDGTSTTVRLGGLIVYLTCSLEPEEDGEQVDLFLERNNSFERDRDDLLIFPPDTGTDGGFGACMRRVQ